MYNMNMNFQPLAAQGLGGYGTSSMLHQGPASLQSAYANDGGVQLKLLYNPLFPAAYVGFPYRPFDTEWIPDNTRFVQGFAKLHSLSLTSAFFKGHQISSRPPDKPIQNQLNLPTFKADAEYEGYAAQSAAYKLSALLQTIYYQWFGKKGFDSSIGKQLCEKSDGKTSEGLLLSMMYAQLITLIQHKDAQKAGPAFQSMQNSELHKKVYDVLTEASKCNYIYQYYIHIVRVDSTPPNYYFLPKIEKAMLHHYGIRNYLLCKLYLANSMRAAGQLMEALNEMIYLVKLSMPAPGHCFPCEQPIEQFGCQVDVKPLNDFPDVRAALILALLACGYGQDCEYFIISGGYVALGKQTFQGSNYCRSGVLFESEYYHLPSRCNFPATADKEAIAQEVANYYNTLHALCIKCPYACCSPHRDYEDLTKQQEFYLAKDFLSYRYTLSHAVIYTPEDEFLSNCGVSNMNWQRGRLSTCSYMSEIPAVLAYPERYQTNYFYASLLTEADQSTNDYIYRNPSLPKLIPHREFQVSDTDIQRCSIEQAIASNKCSVGRNFDYQARDEPKIKRLALQHHSMGLLSYDSYNCYINQTYFLHNFTQKTDFDNPDFQFVLKAFEFSSTSRFSFSEILFYGANFDFDADSPQFNYAGRDKGLISGIKHSSSANQQAFDFINMTALYTLLLLRLNKRALWASKITKQVQKSLSLSGCPCGIAQAQLPHFLGVKALIEIIHQKEYLNYLDQFLIDYPQPPEIDTGLLFQVLETNTYLPLYLFGAVSLPDVGIVRYLTHIFTVEEYPFYRTPSCAFATQESKQMQAVLYAADFGHFWRSDEHLLRMELNKTLDKIHPGEGTYSAHSMLPPGLFLLREAFDAFLQFYMLQSVVNMASLNNSYYQQYAAAVGVSDKEEALPDSGSLSSMSNNYLFVPQSYVNLQNTNMSKANIYGMIFEKRLFPAIKQKEDYMVTLNFNHGYINMQRNLMRVLGSLLQQVGDLEVNQIIQFVFNQVFTSFGQPAQGLASSFQQYFSLDLYNIIVQQIGKVLPEVLEFQEMPKITTKAVKKGKKDYKKREVKDLVVEQDNIVISQNDAVWKMMLQNMGLQINFALNQVLRQKEILLENQQHIILQPAGYQKAQIKFYLQSVTELTYQFEVLLGQYFYLAPRAPARRFLRSLVNLMGVYGTSELYAVYLSIIYTLHDYCAVAQSDSPEFRSRFTGNGSVADSQTALGTFWASYSQALAGQTVTDQSSYQNAKNVIYCRVPEVLTTSIPLYRQPQTAATYAKALMNYLLHDIVAASGVRVGYGRIYSLNLLHLSILSGNPAQLYLLLQHYSFDMCDLLNGLQLACLTANPFAQRILLNYAPQGFRRAPLADYIAQINAVRRRYNAQNQGHQLPLIRPDVDSVLCAKVCDIQQVLTAYFADRVSLLYENQEPLYYSEYDVSAGGDSAVQSAYKSQSVPRGQNGQNSYNGYSTQSGQRMQRQHFPLRFGRVDDAKKKFQEVNNIVEGSSAVQFQLFYLIMSSNSRYCVQASCQCCKLYRQAIYTLNDEFHGYFSLQMPEKCVVQLAAQRKLVEYTSNFTTVRKNAVSLTLSRHIQLCISTLTSLPKFSQYIIIKRGKSINLTQLKLENTALFRLEDFNFIPLTTPLTLAAQLYSEALEELLLQFKKDSAENTAPRGYLNHKDGLGLSALNHAAIVYCLFATKMLKYQNEIDEYQKQSGKYAALSDEMRNIKQMFKLAQGNLLLLLQHGASSFVCDNINLAPRDRIMLFVIKQKLCTIDENQLLALNKNVELMLNCLYYYNDLLIKSQIEQTQCANSKKIIAQYSTAPDQRQKQKFYILGSQLAQQLKIKDLAFGFDLQKYKNLIYIETNDLDFAKPVYESLALIIHHLGTEDQPYDYNAYCANHQVDYGDIYSQIPRYIIVGAPVISYRNFERFERGEDYVEDKAQDSIKKYEQFLFPDRQCMQFFNQDIRSRPEMRNYVQRSITSDKFCEIQLANRIAYRLWRNFDHRGIEVNIVRSGRNILTSINFVTKNEKIVHRHVCQCYDDLALFEARKATNRSCFVVYIVNKVKYCKISLGPHQEALSIDQCVLLGRIFKRASVYVYLSSQQPFRTQKRFAARCSDAMVGFERRTLASVIGNSELINLKLFRPTEKPMEIDLYMQQKLQRDARGFYIVDHVQASVDGKGDVAVQATSPQK